MCDDIYLNAQQAAAYTGLSRQRIYQLAEDGSIGRRIAGYWVFTPDELDTYKAIPKNKGGRPPKIPSAPTL
jgi:hypothetical protein